MGILRRSCRRIAAWTTIFCKGRDLPLYGHCGSGFTIRSRPDDFCEPPIADPHDGWCGEGRLNTVPYPIRLGNLECSRFLSYASEIEAPTCGQPTPPGGPAGTHHPGGRSVDRRRDLEGHKSFPTDECGAEDDVLSRRAVPAG